jgi:hypothetical protein
MFPRTCGRKIRTLVNALGVLPFRPASGAEGAAFDGRKPGAATASNPKSITIAAMAAVSIHDPRIARTINK